MDAKTLFDISGKKVLVTGGARGIGKTLATAFAQSGADIALADINYEGAAKTAEELRQYNVQTMAVEVDVTKKDQVEHMTQKVLDTFSTIDILINNAGICINEKSEEMSFESWSKSIDINLTGIFLVAQSVGRVMIKNRKGSIINTASIAAHVTLVPQPQVGYNASKGGVLLLTRSLACDWAQYGVRINSISPGYIATDMTGSNEQKQWVPVWEDCTPMGRLGRAEELVGAALYLASDASSYTTGTDIAVDGGYTAR